MDGLENEHAGIPRDHRYLYLSTASCPAPRRISKVYYDPEGLVPYSLRTVRRRSRAFPSPRDPSG
jgi:hypothetical protein